MVAADRRKEFGTGLRDVLERRGTLAPPRPVFRTLTLLVRDENELSDPFASYPVRAEAARVAA